MTTKKRKRLKTVKVSIYRNLDITKKESGTKRYGFNHVIQIIRLYNKHD